jgi:hypothetical protein
MKILLLICGSLLLTASLFGQGKRLWVLRPTGEMVEYDPTTFAAKQTVKLPPEAGKSPANVSVNRMGQVLFVPAVTLPLSDEDASSPHKIWLWNGHTAATIDQGVEHKSEKPGSNEAVTESAPAAYLSADGSHLFWFANRVRRLQREDVDLSTGNTWQGWSTDLAGAGREEIASVKLPDCSCPTGSCEDSCPSGVVWAPDNGIENFFLMTKFFMGQSGAVYKGSAIYRQQGGKWTANTPADSLERVLDADSAGNVIVEAIPDTGCCGWANQSNDQTLVLTNGKKLTVFDEQATYKNPDYDVSFFTSTARLSPDMGRVAMTIVATAQPNKTIQLSEQGQASPEESQRIRKALAELPAVAVKSVEDVPRQIVLLPHASVVGWFNEKELLIVEDHLLVGYNVETGTRRKSSVKVEDAAHVFLR